MHEVRERLVAADKHHGNPLAIAALKLRIAGDVDVLELEPELRPDRVDHAPGARAEVATRGAVERDLRRLGSVDLHPVGPTGHFRRNAARAGIR